MVCAFEIASHWRRWLEGNWRLLEGWFFEISSDILGPPDMWWVGLKYSGTPGIWGCERNMERIFIEIHWKSEIGSKVRVPKCCTTNHPLYGDNQESFPCFSNNHTIVNLKASYRTFILCFADVPKSKHKIWNLNHMTLIVHYISHWWWSKLSKSMQLHKKLP